MLPNDTPETFAERKRAAVQTLAELAKWPHCRHDEAHSVNDFDAVVEKRAGYGHIPDAVLREGRSGPVNDYKWQIFAQTLWETVGRDRAAVEEMLAEERDWTNTTKATDGSRGQAQAAHRARLLTYEWLLEADDE